jgi:hypothetical protein
MLAWPQAATVLRKPATIALIFLGHRSIPYDRFADR